ncbi:tRNA pseudouridine(13) synthase TruD [Candidatus Woesearchaeota archaeon]|jgi:tRNA pseudouridine13 synthase|nr:tRNA pseudouridine(13) synthase TruD [Candidatus Woesearchaeota archaeon]
MYKLKQIPEDFIVEEIANLKLVPKGKFLIYEMKKKDCNTVHAIEQLAKHLKVPLKFIGFAGSKDRHAVTTQFISVKKARPNFQFLLDQFSSDLISLDLIGEADEPLSLGDLETNRFVITVRNLTDDDTNKIQSFKPDQIENYFDEQRFSEKNPLIGIEVLKGNFKEVCDLCDEYCCRDHLKKQSKDFVGAFKRIPMKIRLMYIHAFQSLLFNRALQQLTEEQTKNPTLTKYSFGTFAFSTQDTITEQNLPLIGFASEFETGKINELFTSYLKEYDITLRDFAIRSIPALSCEGDLRPAYFKVSGFEYELMDDDLNSDKKKIVLKFILPKGSYATIVIKKIFGQLIKSK